MTRDEVVQEITAVVKEQMSHRTGPKRAAANVTEDTKLFGSGAELDSLSLVTVIVEVEAALDERYGVSVALATDHAMSQRRSPFRTVASLADYVVELAGSAPQGAG